MGVLPDEIHCFFRLPFLELRFPLQSCMAQPDPDSFDEPDYRLITAFA